MVNYIFDILPVELQSYIFQLAHVWAYESVLCHIDKKAYFFDKTFKSGYSFGQLLLQVNRLEDVLVDAINEHQYTRMRVNTNIPEVILKKTCGRHYEQKIRDFLMSRNRLPYKLRKYILYNRRRHDTTKYHYYFFICAKPDCDIVDLRQYPGGIESWSYYNDQNMAELSDISKHQWLYLEYDIQINNMRNLSTVKDRITFIKESTREHLSIF